MGRNMRTRPDEQLRQTIWLRFHNGDGRDFYDVRIGTVMSTDRHAVESIEFAPTTVEVPPSYSRCDVIVGRWPHEEAR